VGRVWEGGVVRGGKPGEGGMCGDGMGEGGCVGMGDLMAN